MNSLLAFEQHALSAFHAGDCVLEIAPDRNPSTLREAVHTAVSAWETAELVTQIGSWTDVSGPPDHTMTSEYEIPVADDTFDVVVSGNVIEHVREIWRWMPELARVTKPGGRVVTVAPVSWPYHPAPLDCWRIYPEGMAALCEYAGLVAETIWWGSIEPRPSRRNYPGVGDNWREHARRGWRTRIKALIGYPVPVAYDLVAVARKPGPGTAAPGGLDRTAST